jgi:hypothetical protein
MNRSALDEIITLATTKHLAVDGRPPDKFVMRTFLSKTQNLSTEIDKNLPPEKPPQYIATVHVTGPAGSYFFVVN